MSDRSYPFPVVHPVYLSGFSRYPDRVKVSMEDGKVIDYVREVKQPAPVFKDALDKFTELCIGYKYKRRKRNECGRDIRN